MNLADLRIFVAVVETGSVTRASERVHCVQSNVTARVKGLEARLGVPLFTRCGKRLVITGKGSELLAYAKKLLALAADAERAVMSTAPAGLLRLGSIETAAAVRLPPLLSRFHAAFPDVKVSLVTGTTQEQVSALMEGQRDLIFVSGPIGDPGVREETLWREELVLVTAIDHPPVATCKDIKNRTILAFRAGCSYRRRLESWLDDDGVVPGQVMEYGSLDAIIGCVAADMGVAILPASVAQRRDDRVRQHPLPEKFRISHTSCAWLAGTDLDIAASSLIAMAKETL
ncbi:LysR family transcriptional regulator [Telmatospirillum sp.]|uniref:LysR family transcriptional regulator n=1 Tax=Telmatospirillum sp. TaxID=2079197 RepID=UPI0028421B21|nr:LysR family transcriptional regulator [Telmatospirillum sp.]MDR3440914.1 LysR family transcriptional regulator [Telmatospirillum sp.]